MEVRSGHNIPVKDRLSAGFKGPRDAVHKQKHGNRPLYVNTNIYAYIRVWPLPIYERRVDYREKKKERNNMNERSYYH